MATQTQNHYFVPTPTVYPFVLSGGMLTLVLGFIFSVNEYAGAGKWMMLLGITAILSMIFLWLSKVVAENQSGAYKGWEDKSFRWGMIGFICSEATFFAAFFGALFYMRVISVPELAGYDADLTPYKDFLGSWPSAGPGGATVLGEYAAAQFTPMGAWGIPALNTMLLLSSGATITWAHWGLLKNKRQQLIIGTALTVALGMTFLGFQAYEYYHAYNELGLTMGAGAYGSSFFMLTGFHGFHVTIGTIMLMVILLRSIKGHFTPEHHFGFEGVAWYWHFVDVVWLGLFIFVYWL